MSEFENMANEYMKDLAKKQDKYVLQNLSFENLIELQKMVMAEIEKRVNDTAKEQWKDCGIVTIGELTVEEYKNEQNNR